MSQPVTYDAARAGDWGIGRPPDGGQYAEEKLSLPDGANLFMRSWVQARAESPALLLLHGLGAHSGWFLDMGSALAERGLHVYAYDHRGFGRSDGARGHIARGAHYVEDVLEVADVVKRRHPASPLVVLGHSMGGIFALHAAAQDGQAGGSAGARFAGIILMNPWIADRSKVGLGTTLGIVSHGVRGSAKLFAVTGGDEVMTTNAEAATMLHADPYWVRKQSGAFLWHITSMRLAATRRARTVRIPAFVIQAERDLSVVAAATRRCYDRMASTDKTYKMYPGYAHDTEFEADRAALDDDIAAWVLQHA